MPPVSSTGDSHQVRDAVDVAIRESRGRSVKLLFEPERNLGERTLSAGSWRKQWLQLLGAS